MNCIAGLTTTWGDARFTMYRYDIVCRQVLYVHLAIWSVFFFICCICVSFIWITFGICYRQMFCIFVCMASFASLMIQMSFYLFLFCFVVFFSYKTEDYTASSLTLWSPSTYLVRMSGSGPATILGWREVWSTSYAHYTLWHYGIFLAFSLRFTNSIQQLLNMFEQL